jgi:PTS system nitrogen regulatory IIA component
MIAVDLIIPELRASSKKQLFELLAEEAANLFDGDAAALFGALMDRERIGSTSIGGCAALPHIKAASIEKTHSIFARLSPPVDYDALDGNPVDMVFLLLAPADSKTTQHLKVLAYISRFLKDSRVCGEIRGADSKEKIEQILADWVQSQAA